MFASFPRPPALLLMVFTTLRLLLSKFIFFNGVYVHRKHWCICAHVDGAFGGTS